MNLVNPTLFIILMPNLYFGCSLGTEVGNGARKTEKKPVSVEGAENTQADKASTAGAPNESQGNLDSRLLIDCASPLAESGASYFKDSKGTVSQLKAGTDTTKTFLSKGQEFTITSIPSGAVYEARIQPKVLDLTCLSISLGDAGNGRQKRTVQYSDFTSLEWTFVGNSVETIILRWQDGMVVETWVKVEP